jgi:hypothetical protein
MEYLLTDVENNILLSLSLQDVINYSQINKHKYDIFKTNKILKYKFKQAQEKVNLCINLLSRKIYQGVWLNTMEEYDKFEYYNNLLNYNNTNNFTELNDYVIVTFQLSQIYKSYDYYVEINLQSSDDEVEDFIIKITNLQLKEFLLHLYYDNKIF